MSRATVKARQNRHAYKGMSVGREGRHRGTRRPPNNGRCAVLKAAQTTLAAKGGYYANEHALRPCHADAAANR